MFSKRLLRNALSPMVVTLSGITILFNSLFRKAPLPIEIKLLPKVIVCKELVGGLNELNWPAKAISPMDVTLSPIKTLVNLLEIKAALPIISTLLLMVKFVRLLPLNADSPITITLFPMVTLDNSFPLKAA